MSTFYIDTGTSYGDVAMLRQLAKFEGIEFNKVSLNVTKSLTESDNPEDWPVIFECSCLIPGVRKFMVYIRNVTCGYEGAGPDDLIECLEITDFLGFVAKQEIYSRETLKCLYHKI